MSDLAVAADKARDWTRRRDEQIRAARKGGASLRAIARETGLSHTAVANIAGRP